MELAWWQLPPRCRSPPHRPLSSRPHPTQYNAPMSLGTRPPQSTTPPPPHPRHPRAHARPAKVPQRALRSRGPATASRPRAVESQTVPKTPAVASPAPVTGPPASSRLSVELMSPLLPAKRAQARRPVAKRRACLPSPPALRSLTTQRRRALPSASQRRAGLRPTARAPPPPELPVTAMPEELMAKRPSAEARLTTRQCHLAPLLAIRRPARLSGLAESSSATAGRRSASRHPPMKGGRSVMTARPLSRKSPQLLHPQPGARWAACRPRPARDRRVPRLDPGLSLSKRRGWHRCPRSSCPRQKTPVPRKARRRPATPPRCCCPTAATVGPPGRGRAST
mmetsp:Transcript_49740/g.143121  ORF Transcript_49740/g.143121 Transcript_49740/m.143121 type:complete len:338 (-) Transcript_49740:463-1476(-)